MAKDDKASSESLRLILVVFLGGCTFSEISALRFLGREKGKNRKVTAGLHGFWGQHVLSRKVFLLAVVPLVQPCWDLL